MLIYPITQCIKRVGITWKGRQGTRRSTGEKSIFALLRQTSYGVKDVFKTLDIRWDGMKSLGSIGGNDIKTQYHPTSYGVKETIFISETQLYWIIFRSNKPRAIDFQNWVCGDVLPHYAKQAAMVRH